MESFNKKVQSMTAKEIIMAMVEGLRHPVTKIDMSTFGQVVEGICYGCAATNAICRISDIDKKEFLRISPDNAMSIIGDSVEEVGFISNFELAIDYLREGSLKNYNYMALSEHFALIHNDEDIPLPYLNDDFTQEQLNQYVKLAESQ